MIPSDESIRVSRHSGSAETIDSLVLVWVLIGSFPLVLPDSLRSFTFLDGRRPVTGTDHLPPTPQLR